MPSASPTDVCLPTRAEIDGALRDLAAPIAQYDWLVQEVRMRDVSADPGFQRRYNHFWRVRKNAAWRASYYALLERAKSEPIGFETALRALHQRTGTIEASFASKLVATLDPTQPVLDAFVLKYFGLRLPYPYQDDRIGRTVNVYRSVQRGVDRIVRSDVMPEIRTAFTERYPGTRLSDAKMVDFVLWQVRPKAEPHSKDGDVLTRVGVDDASARLGDLLARVERGEGFLLVDGDRPVARLVKP
jgi:hypothetical protein